MASRPDRQPANSNLDFNHLVEGGMQVGALVEDKKATLNGLADVVQRFLPRFALGMASGQSRTGRDVAAVFRVRLDNDLQLHAIPSLGSDIRP